MTLAFRARRDFCAYLLVLQRRRSLSALAFAWHSSQIRFGQTTSSSHRRHLRDSRRRISRARAFDVLSNSALFSAYSFTLPGLRRSQSR
jgi:hypothetical protein